jgi:hypothetical protein
LAEQPAAGPGHHARRLVFGVDHGIAGTVYGTIVVMATLTAGSIGRVGLWKMAIGLLFTTGVLWLAHVYAHGLGESIARGRRVDWPELTSIGRHEAPIALSAVAPAAAIVLGAIGVFGRTTSIWLAFGIGLATLAVEGIRYARIERMGRVGAAVLITVNLALGLAIVALTVVLSH